MKADVGDWLVIKGTTTELADQRGLITEVHGAEGAPPYVVHWLDNDHVATVFPGTDAFVVTATCLLYTSPSPRDRTRSRMPSSA